MAQGRPNQYLDEALERAQKQLGHLDYAVLKQAVEHDPPRTMPTAIEKSGLGKLDAAAILGMSDAELDASWSQIGRWFDATRRRDEDDAFLVDAGAAVLKELDDRDLDADGPMRARVKAIYAAPPRKKKPKKPKIVRKAPLSTRQINRLPDSAFAVILSGGEKDEGGRTKPRSLRKLPFKRADGSIDKPRLRNALARLNQTDLTSAQRASAKRKLDAAAKEALPSSEAAQKASHLSSQRCPPGMRFDREKGRCVSMTTKGFEFGEPEGGMHAHGLNRRSGRTQTDGAHLHVFVMPGTQRVIATMEDGVHTHEINGDVAPLSGSEHTHRIFVEGREMLTESDGPHEHQLMVETSGFDGLHKHVLELEDGTRITSISPAEFVEMFDAFAIGDDAPPASFYTRALRLAAMFEEQQEQRFRELDSVGDALTLMRAAEKTAVGDVEVETEAQMLEAMSKTAGDGVVVVSFDGKQRALLTEYLPAVAVKEVIDDVVWLELDKSGAMPKNGYDVVPGDVVEVSSAGIIGFSSKAEPDDPVVAVDRIEQSIKNADELRMLGFTGPDDAPITFVAASPTDLEIARGEPLVGADGEAFKSMYLEPLGLKKADVRIGFAVPMKTVRPTDRHVELWAPWLLEKAGTGLVIALGKVAKRALGDEADFVLPHPAAVRKFGDRGELERKRKAIVKVLDDSPRHVSHHGNDIGTSGPIDTADPEILADATSGLRQTSTVKVVKSLAEKQIVYGAVLDPYIVDAHDDWTPPAEVEATAHQYLKDARVVGLQHSDVAKAEVVESTLVEYPSKQDYTAAMNNEPHSVHRKQFGDDFVHSGTWILGVQLGDEEWAAYERGELNNFSPGGYSFKEQIDQAEMPEVTVIDLVES